MSWIGFSADASIRRNTLWNFAGVAAPVPAALLAIPLLISRLGDERFGLLTIAWAVMGYFSIFDFGLSRGTTKYLAQALGDGREEAARVLFWSSAAAHLVLGLAGGFLLFSLAPWLAAALDVPPGLREETATVFVLLALSVPLIVLTSVARGLLEAVHRFDLVNAVKLPASLITYLGPLAALAFTERLPPVVMVILGARAAVLLVYGVMCSRAFPAVRTFAAPRAWALAPLVGLGGWITVGTVMTPVIVSLDRFVIGSAVSVAAVSAYAAPYEVVTKLWMFSASLLGVLFPRFAVLQTRPEELRTLYHRAVEWLAVCTTPAAVLILAYAPEFFRAWLGEEIAASGAVVAQWLAVGVLVNVIAQVPYTVLQATGHADAAGKLQLLGLAIYASAIWFVAVEWGVAGVAIAWAVRAAVDAGLMFAAVRVRLGFAGIARWTGRGAMVAAAALALIIWCWQLVPLIAPSPILKAIIVCISVGMFLYLATRGLQMRLLGAAVPLNAGKT